MVKNIKFVNKPISILEKWYSDKLNLNILNIGESEMEKSHAVNQILDNIKYNKENKIFIFGYINNYMNFIKKNKGLFILYDHYNINSLMHNHIIGFEYIDLYSNYWNTSFNNISDKFNFINAMLRWILTDIKRNKTLFTTIVLENIDLLIEYDPIMYLIQEILVESNNNPNIQLIINIQNISSFKLNKIIFNEFMSKIDLISIFNSSDENMKNIKNYFNLELKSKVLENFPMLEKGHSIIINKNVKPLKISGLNWINSNKIYN